MEYSVLISVYAKEEPAYLDTAIQSMLDQTVRTDDFVIVCDGPLTAELDAVLERHLAQNPAVLHLVRLPQNIGTGAALNIGLTHCKNELIAKMDSDDISVLDRCERQLKEFAEDDRLTVVGGNILEFTEDPAKPVSRRLVPCDNEGIQKYARRRQPFNNMTVMYKRSAVLKVGGYKAMTRSEDYDLYVRILHEGYYYSVSTKIIECLASGRPLLAYGPEDIASMAYLRRNDCAALACSRQELPATVRAVLTQEPYRAELVGHAMAVSGREAGNSRRLHQLLEGVLRDRMCAVCR